LILIGDENFVGDRLAIGFCTSRYGEVVASNLYGGELRTLNFEVSVVMA
jgi:hypothetical protein